MSSRTFDFLVIGIAKMIEGDPLPDELLYSLNQLSIKTWFDTPPTVRSVLQRCEQPLATWWKEKIPNQMDASMPLLENGNLSESTESYLIWLKDNEVDYKNAISQLHTVMDNLAFRHLIQQLRDAQTAKPGAAQDEYVRLRRFIIEHPFVDRYDLIKAFRDGRIITPENVLSLYIETSNISETLCPSHQRSERKFHNCTRCGAVRVKLGALQSINPNVCGKHCPKPRGGWQKIIPSRQLLVLRLGVQLRTLIPGVPELRLFEQLQTRHERQPERLTKPELWPQIDAADIALNIDDEMWVVDVKDQADPFRLGKQLRDIHHSSSLNWHKSFYVYPNERDQQPNYRANVLHTAQLKRTHLLNETKFIALVEEKLQEG